MLKECIVAWLANTNFSFFNRLVVEQLPNLPGGSDASAAQAGSGGRHPPSRPAHADCGGAPVDGMDWLVPEWALPPPAVGRLARQSPAPRPVGRAATPNPSPPPASVSFHWRGGRKEPRPLRGRAAATPATPSVQKTPPARGTRRVRAVWPSARVCVWGLLLPAGPARCGAAEAGEAAASQLPPLPAGPRAQPLCFGLLPADRRPCRPPAASHDAARQQWQALAAVGLPPLAPPRGGAAWHHLSPPRPPRPGPNTRAGRVLCGQRGRPSGGRRSLQADPAPQRAAAGGGGAHTRAAAAGRRWASDGAAATLAPSKRRGGGSRPAARWRRRRCRRVCGGGRGGVCCAQLCATG